MTKPCKSCKEEIDAAATKCPKCQAFQSWYRNPQLFPVFMLILFLAYMTWNISRYEKPATFADYRDKLSASVVEENLASNGKTSLLTVRIENRTEKTWKSPKVQIESLDAEGKVLSVEHVNEYNVVVAPNSSVLDTFSLRVTPSQPVVKRRATLTHIDSNRF